MSDRRAEALERVGDRQGPAVPDGCEWNPTADAPAYATDEHTRLAQAEVIVGTNGQWRLCASCAALPRFKRFKSRRPINHRCLCGPPGPAPRKPGPPSSR